MTETVLAFDDIPWEVLKRRGHESVRLMELTRFYIQLVKDPHGPNVALFIGNLPINLSQKQYETILNDNLDESMFFLFQRYWLAMLIKTFNCFIVQKLYLHV